MKKILLLALTAILAVSCMEQNEDGTCHAPQSDSSYSYYTTVTIDSCEYIKAYYLSQELSRMLYEKDTREAPSRT